MKYSVINLSLSLLLAMMTIGCSTSKQAMSGKSTMDPYTGTWDYVVTGTPQGEMKGELVIQKESDQYKAMMKGAAGIIDVDNLQIMDNTLMGTFSYQGYTVDMSGMFVGEKFDGEVSVDYNAFPITAVKRNP